MRIERVSANRFRIVHEELRLGLPPEKYEDLFYALPCNTTALWRSLTENVFVSAEDRRILDALISAFPSRSDALDALSQAVRAVAPDTPPRAPDDPTQPPPPPPAGHDDPEKEKES